MIVQTATPARRVRLRLEQPPTGWLRPKTQRYLRRRRAGCVAVTTAGRYGWWDLTDQIKAASLDAGYPPAWFAGWLLVPAACLPNLARRLGPDLRRLRFRRLGKEVGA